MQLDPELLGTVYLIHFDQPFHHASHYLGFTKMGMEHRLARHGTTDGSRLLLAVKKAGIPFKVVRTWLDKTRGFERQLKNRKKASLLCPVCQAAKGKEAQDVL
jgi:hypothetical protein